MGGAGPGGGGAGREGAGPAFAAGPGRSLPGPGWDPRDPVVMDGGWVGRGACCGRGRRSPGPQRDRSGTLRARAGPRPLTVATRYCRVPQSRTARLKRSSRYCKEEPRLVVTWAGPTQEIEASGVLRPPSRLLPSLRRPFCSPLVPAGAPAKRTHSDRSADNLCARRVPGKPDPAEVLTSLRPPLAANWPPGRRRSEQTRELPSACGQLSSVAHCGPVTILIPLPAALKGGPLISPV